uniref:hypothetical protein n=1 Tax=Selenomonas sp. TAMA-11512 TaxID=3095337 RepID=UPI00403FAB85
MDTVGKYETAIKEYIQNQLQEDIMADQLSLKEFVDPFTGSKRERQIKMPPSRGQPVIRVWLSEPFDVLFKVLPQAIGPYRICSNHQFN